MTRKDWMYNIVNTMLLEGKGNSIVYPTIKDDLIEDLIPLKPNLWSFIDTDTSYKISYGEKKRTAIMKYCISRLTLTLIGHG